MLQGAARADLLVHGSAGLVEALLDHRLFGFRVRGETAQKRAILVE